MSYRNPHFPGVKKVIFELMNKWWLAEGQNFLANKVETLEVLDMAAGRCVGLRPAFTRC